MNFEGYKENKSIKKHESYSKEKIEPCLTEDEDIKVTWLKLK